MANRWLTQGQAAELCGTNSSQIQYWRKTGKLKTIYKDGYTCRLYNSNELMKLMEELQQKRIKNHKHHDDISIDAIIIKIKEINDKVCNANMQQELCCTSMADATNDILDVVKMLQQYIKGQQ
jgi:DNA-binding transcriptional MerR regulator